jgi:hypothetical protein
VHDKEFAREWADWLDWEAVSRRHDLPLDFIREWKDRLDWQVMIEWNIAFRGITLSDDFKKEFKKELVKFDPLIV